MARTSPGRVRFAGVVLLICAGVLTAIGLYLVHLALNWVMPAWLPPELDIAPQGDPLPLAALRGGPVGWAAAYVTLFGGVAGLNGLWMLVRGQRTWVLVAPLLILFAIFVAVGIWATLDSGHRLGQIGG